MRAACAYLRDTLIPQLLNDLRESDVSFPMDGRSLSRLLHKRGLNLRYMGMIASLCGEPRLQSFRDVCVTDIITRSFKHVAAKYLRHLPLPLTAACIAHLLNCLLGSELNPKPAADIDPSIRALYDDADLAFADLSPESLRLEVQAEAQRRFRYKLPQGWHVEIRRLQQLREVCLTLGLQIQAKNYVFAPEEPEANGANGVNGVNGANGHGNGEGRKEEEEGS